MTTSLYDDVLSQAQQLDTADQLRLIRELSSRIGQSVQRKGTRSIRELRGLGKEIWEGVDPRAYVNAERDSWDG